MIIVIDGYNLLKQVLHNKEEVTEYQRKSFIAQMEKYARQKNNSIQIFFDAGPETWSFHEDYDLVRVFYSGSLYSADDLIEFFLRENRDKDILLVTSDNRLQIFASDLSIVSMTSLDFYNFIKVKYKKNTKRLSNYIKKIAKDENKELDSLMRKVVINNPKEDFFLKRNLIRIGLVKKKDFF